MNYPAINAAILSVHAGVLHVHVHDCLPSLHVIGKQSCSHIYSKHILTKQHILFIQNTSNLFQNKQNYIILIQFHLIQI